MDKKKFFEELVNAGKVLGPAILTERIYNMMFNHRIHCYKPLFFQMDDFPDLTRERHTFYSYSKNQLVGYVYSLKNAQNKGIFVFSHGYGGGGHHCYLDLIHAICEQGYFVFAYDMTANDESEGHSMKGFTQGMLDADRAISYVESLSEYQHLPLYLCGHSLGAYSVSTALTFHKEVKGVIAFSGFNQATSTFKYNGEKYAGEKSQEFMSYVDIYERLLFGDIANTTAVDAFENCPAKIVIVHSEDDMTVPITAGYDIYHQRFKDNNRFKFIRLFIHGHGTVYDTLEGKHYQDKIRKEFNAYVKKDNPSEEAKEQFLKQLIDRQIYNNCVDKKLIKTAIEFITK